MLLLNFAILALSFSHHVAGWGDLGHRTVALVAQKYLTSEASQLLNEILANNQGFDFSDAATWADTIKRARPYTKTWHYIDAQDDPPTVCGLKYPKDCCDQGKDGCIVTAIANQTSLFLDPDSSSIVQKEALMFIMHLIGDLHQPLHVENKARGGNEIHVCFRKACSGNNLHSVWDKYIPHKIVGIPNAATNAEEKTAAADWAEKLFTLNQKSGISAQQECSDVSKATECSLGWAKESNTWICKYVLKESVEWLESNDLSLEYYEGAVPIVEEAIGKAGARLGAWLNALAAESLSGASHRSQQFLGEERQDL